MSKKLADHCIYSENGWERKLEGPFYKSAINPILIARKGRGLVKVFRLVPVELMDVPDVVTTYHKEIEE